MTDAELLAKIDELVGAPDDESEVEHQARVVAMTRLKEARIIRRGNVPH